MKSSFLPKYEQKIVKISALCSEALYRAEILTIFRSYFGRNNDFINLFWNLMTTIVRILLKKICELIMQYNWSAHQHLVAKRSASACQCLVSGSSTQEPKKSAAYVVGLWFCLCFKCSTIPQCVQLRISNPQLKYGFCKKSLRNTFLSIPYFRE